ncbi:MAG TPA: transketolase [Acidimicrobiales bacterium]|nr:transketolase [Acidimicrobiales bacterium]
MGTPELEQRAIDVIRGLAMDAPHRARSGHQGTAMALAPLAHVLWTRILRYDAADPAWPDRDRFVLSAGHASILLYSMLHLTGYGLTLRDLEDFRQWGSRTPGHPEHGHTVGVEVTTGPLGQGLANAVGMAIAERNLRARLGAEIVDHHVYCIAGDGDLSEGLSHEAGSLAGHLGLGRLVCVYDDNHISIDGPTELALSDDAAGRFRSYGWHVEELGEAAEDLEALEGALRTAAAVEDRPSLLIVRSHIAYPSPTKTDDHEAHGYALKDDDIRAAKEVMGLPPDEAFYVPDDVLELYRSAGSRGAEVREAWAERRAAYAGDKALLDACLDARPLPGWTEALPSWSPGESVATRKASGACLQALADHVPALLAGGADLTSNTGTVLKDHGVQSRQDPAGRQIYFGIREHAMASSMTGMALHGGALPVGGTFLVFSDYCRPAIRLAALSGARVIYSFTHDSVGVGEDGPTHQPVEHAAALRAIPGLCVLRPADANETAAAWRIAVEREGPTALLLTRQDVPVLEGTAGAPVELGGYVLVAVDDPDLVLVGTGSEVSVCVEAARLLTEEGIATQVSSLPSWDLFAAQGEAHQDAVLPPDVPTLAVEAGSTFGWDRWADDCVGIDRFGASAPGEQVLAELGFTPDNVAERARRLLEDLEDS